MKFFKIFIFLLIVVNTLLASRWVLDGNLFFHTDIARDFLLLEDVVDNKHLTLIGPRSGAIPGVFHGPMWLYLNLPAYLVGGGNPVVVAWFWVILYVLSLFIVYWVGKKMFDEKVALLSVVLLSSSTALGIRSLFNPYGALMLSPLFLYVFIKYLQTAKIKNLVLSLLILGFIIQFQMAFGVPILLLTAGYLSYFFFKRKLFKHLGGFFVLLIPLSSFLLFDLRNNFLQFKSVTNYLSGIEKHGQVSSTFPQLLKLRVEDVVLNNFGDITAHQNQLSILLAFFLVGVAFLTLRNKKSSFSFFYTIFFYFFLGFWLLSFFFKGPMWSYYYLPFVPLIIIFFCSLSKVFKGVIFYPVFLLILISNLITNFKDATLYNPDVLKQDVSTWKFNLRAAQDVYQNSPLEFGYYIFTPDLYGYSPRYAMNYVQKGYRDKKVFPYKKYPVTFLLVAPPPIYGRDPESVWYKKNTNSTKWKSGDIRINKEPTNILTYQNGFKVEKYLLDSEELKIEANPYLINSIFFR